MKSEKDSPHVITFPPLIYIGGLLIGFLLHYVKPLMFLENDLFFYFGVGLIIVSIIIFIVATKFFVRAQTNVDVRKSTTSIVVNGPYKFSRNPIYLSMTLLYLGIFFLIKDLWLFILLIPVLLIIHHGVIKREEKYLTEKFGETYIKYKKSVRRWL